MRKLFLVAAAASFALVATPTHDANAIIECTGECVVAEPARPPSGIIEDVNTVTGESIRWSYVVESGDCLHTRNGTGILDRFGISLDELRRANQGIAIPMCFPTRARSAAPIVLTIPRRAPYTGHTLTLTF